MKKAEKHAAPRRCRLTVRLRGSRWQDFAVCAIGAKPCRKCSGCENYNPALYEERMQVLEVKVHEVQETLHNVKPAITIHMSPPIKGIKEDER